MPKLVCFSRFAALLEGQIRTRSAAAFSPATKGYPRRQTRLHERKAEQTGRRNQADAATNTLSHRPSRCAHPVASSNPCGSGRESGAGVAIRTKPPSLAPASILLPKPSVMETGHSAALRSDEI
jgi:hypothetical protein